MTWYILRAATRQEFRACASLKELDIDHYLPCETVNRQINREMHRIERPLFPGYLFADIADREFHAATHAAAVHAPVRVTLPNGERVPAQVPPGLVAALQDAQARGDFDRTIVPPEEPLTVGESLRIKGGPFDGLIGAMMEVLRNDRISLLLNSRIIEVAMSQVERAA